jgi:hypothetical protein
MSIPPHDSELLDFDALYLKALRGSERLEGKPYYEPEADALFYFFKEGASNAYRINGFVTLYRSIESGELVGLQLKRIKRLTQELRKRGKKPKVLTIRLLLQRTLTNEGTRGASIRELLDMPVADQTLPSEALA